MKKRMVSLALALLSALTLLAPALTTTASAAAEPEPQEHTVEYYGWYIGNKPPNPKATITYTGFYGFFKLPGGNAGAFSLSGGAQAYLASDASSNSVALLADGSEIRVTLHPDERDRQYQSHSEWWTNSVIYQGKVVEKNQGNEMLKYGAFLTGHTIIDGVGSSNAGGVIYKRSPGKSAPGELSGLALSNFGGFPVDLFGQANGPATWEVFPYDEEFFATSDGFKNEKYQDWNYKPQGFYGTEWGHQTGPCEYVIKVQNGLLRYDFPIGNGVEGYDKLFGWGSSWAYDSIGLGMALSVNKDQLKELKQTGTMTFHKGTDLEYQYDYPEIRDLLDPPPEEEVVYTGPCPQFTRVGGYDNGFGMSGKVSNPTNQTVSGRWGIISFWDHSSQDPDDYYMCWNVLRYTVKPGDSMDVGVHTEHIGFGNDYIELKETADITEIPDNYKIIFVDLNSDSDYQEFIDCAEERVFEFSWLFPNLEGYYDCAERENARGSSCSTEWLGDNYYLSNSSRLTAEQMAEYKAANEANRQWMRETFGV